MASKARELADVIGTQDTTENVLQGRRNLIINGAMQVAQRGTSFTGVTTSGKYGADRHQFYNSTSAFAVTISQSTNAPSGFSNSARIEVTSAGTIGAADYCHYIYSHEGQDLQQLGFGTSDAKQISLSFWCRTNVPQTYQYNLFNTDSGVMEGHTFTISTSNTWEYKTIVFSADTSNTFTNDNTDGLRHIFPLAAGSNFSSGSTQTTWASHSIADRGAGLTDKTVFGETVGNYFEITGVQLEVGSVATPFEHRSYGEELALCQRYCFVLGAAGFSSPTDSAYARYPMVANSTSTCLWFLTYPSTMRASPSLTLDGATTDINIYNYENASANNLSSFNMAEGSIRHGQISVTISGTHTIGQFISWRWDNSPNAALIFDAEL